MKITTQDYARVEKLIRGTLEKFPLEKTQADYKTRNLSDTRLVWDYWHATLQRLQVTDVEQYLYLRGLHDYLDDSHIETALRAILVTPRGA